MPTAFYQSRKSFFSVVFLMFIFVPMSSQSYWQQQVDYTIGVKLDDQRHELHGVATIEYINNSPHELTFIWFHLWPNAYSNNNTALAKQKLKGNRQEDLFNNPNKRGYMDSLAFTIDGQTVKTEPHPEHNDICKLLLNKPLASGQKITISTPFRVKIPWGGISRMGHMGQSYQITQWYPKPAVYDIKGWHPIPYLDQGEFYSEFGSFDVSITLPRNYKVASTGELQTASEMEWLNELAEKDAQRDSFPRAEPLTNSDSVYKTIRYTENQVHDFAWFADKNFHVLRGEVKLPHSGKSVTTWSFFPGRAAKFWKKAPSYIHDAVYNYSLWLGDYPYKNCTALEGPLGAGGGMEYPGITIVSSGGSDISLDMVITHEVGHNWFYGILGFNERDYPYLDEGINTFYEMRYMDWKYPQKSLAERIGFPPFVGKLTGMDKLNGSEYYSLMYRGPASYRTDQPINLTSTEYSFTNYGVIVYMKSGLSYNYLKSYLGEAEFDRIMKLFYEKWKFKHPQPEDFRSIFEENTSKDVSWFFKELVPTTDKLDYKIKRVNNNQLLVKNKGELATPLLINGVTNDSVLFEKWVPGFKGRKRITLPDTAVNLLAIDYKQNTPELYRNNNYLRTEGLFRKTEPVKLKFFTTLNDYKYSVIQYVPAIGWNSGNQIMAGALLHNGILIKKPFEYQLMPLYGFKGNKLAGMGKLTWNIFPDFANIRILSFSVSGMQFAFDEHTNYNKLKVEARAVFHNSSYSFYPKHSLFANFTRATDPFTLILYLKEYNNVFNLNYAYQNPEKINLTNVNYNFKANKDFGRTSVEAIFNLKPSFFKSPLKLRLFTGGMLYNSSGAFENPFMVNGRNGFFDYEYEGIFPGRFDGGGLWSHQFMPVEGAMALPYFKAANKFMVTVGGDFKLLSKSIFKLVRLYGNTAYYTFDLDSEFLYEAGVKVGQPGFFEVYFPLIYKKDDFNYMNYGDLIRFNLNLNILSPFNIMERVPNI